MKLVDQAQKLLDLMMQSVSEENDKAIQELEVQLTAAITTCVDVTELKEILSEDEGIARLIYLPIPLIRQIFEQMLLLAPKDWNVLAGFAGYLSMYGPHGGEDDVRSDLLFNEAMRLKAELAE